jgi:hypothetical protein
LEQQPNLLFSIRLRLDSSNKCWILVVVTRFAAQWLIHHVQLKWRSESEDSDIWLSFMKPAGKQARQCRLTNAAWASQQQRPRFAFEKRPQILPNKRPPSDKGVTSWQMYAAIASQHSREGRAFLNLNGRVDIDQWPIHCPVEQNRQRPLRKHITNCQSFGSRFTGR